jgi:DNA-binding LacI/PurR family transcriptional regulator
LASREVPLVFIDIGPNGPGISVLKVDYHRGIRQGVQHLAALGHRNISFVSGPERLHSAQSRVSAFLKAMQECGIASNPHRVVGGDHTMEGGIVAMESILSAKIRPTAVMCSNDLTAIGVLHKLYRAGLRVPDDLSVIGFDDIHIAEVTTPPLTTIQMSRFELARAAVTALRIQVEGDSGFTEKREFNIQTNLVVRESTCYPQGTMNYVQNRAHRSKSKK